MGKYTEIAKRLRKKQEAENVIDGHEVSEVLWQTDRTIVFRDRSGNVWRRVHAWHMTWPITVENTK